MKSKYLVIITILSVGLAILAGVDYVVSNTSKSVANTNATIVNGAKTDNKIYDQVLSEVLPEKGFQSKIALGSSIEKLVQNGVIDQQKFEGIYQSRGGLPDEFKNVLTSASNNPILLTTGNAKYYLNLLWPLGLSNYMEANKSSPINGKNVNNFASTGGWNLGKENNGGAYFNKFAMVPLTKAEEALVVSVAQNIYRPCCGNSTFFQDCNHGSALLGLLELGASQGLTEDQLYKEALAFNSFWFPQNYVQIGLYFKVIKSTDWQNVDPKIALSKDFSSSGGNANIQSEVSKVPNLVPSNATYGGGSCGA